MALLNQENRLRGEKDCRRDMRKQKDPIPLGRYRGLPQFLKQGTRKEVKGRNGGLWGGGVQGFDRLSSVRWENAFPLGRELGRNQKRARGESTR